MTISPEYRPRLIVMVKDPRAGRVKTRLGRDIGLTAAAWWYRHHVRRLLRRLSDPRWDLILAVSPDRDGMVSRAFPHHLPRLPQGPGSLGDRMGRLLRLDAPGPVLIVGSDIPGITQKHIAAAIRALGSSDAVLGPAPDGGYWLIGLARRKPVPLSLFQNVRWSTEHARADTIATLPGHRIAHAAVLRDIDTAADFAAQ